MTAATKRQTETARAAVDRYQVLDSTPEPAFDRIVELARQLLAMPMAGLGIVTDDRLFIKAASGYEPAPVPFERSLSREAVDSGRFFQVGDLRRDPRFANYPQVVGEKALRFFAASPLLTPGGVAVGALAVMDWRPRLAFEAREQRLLADLAAIAVDELELRAERGQSERRHESLGPRGEPLTSLGTLAASIAHEINNPLAYVASNLAYVRRELWNLRAGGKDAPPPDLDALEQALADAEGGAGRIAGIVHDLQVGVDFAGIAAAQATGAPPPAPDPALPLRVLVVDDEELIGKAIRRLLRHGYDVTAVTRASDALAKIEAGERWDVILSDIVMPGMTGIELHEKLLARFPDQADRTLFVSAGGFTSQAQRFLERFPGRRLDKPFAADALVAAIHAVVLRSGRAKPSGQGR